MRMNYGGFMHLEGRPDVNWHVCTRCMLFQLLDAFNDRPFAQINVFPWPSLTRGLVCLVKADSAPCFVPFRPACAMQNIFN